jgi:hypothetical protein
MASTHTTPIPTSAGDRRLVGRWTVERTGGMLPPLFGVGKQIDGDRGWTTVAGVKLMRFEVVGLELHYGWPFTGVVDVLTPETSSSYAGCATFRGRTFGTFRLVRER